MKKLFPVVFVFLANCLFAQQLQLPVNKTLSAEQEIEIVLNPEIDRVVITLQNAIGSESVAYWTKFTGENETPENKIGPKKYRTFTLAPKIEDESEPIRLDKKELVIIIGDSDKLVLKVEKGKVNIQVKPSEK